MSLSLKAKKSILFVLFLSLFLHTACANDGAIVDGTIVDADPSLQDGNTQSHDTNGGDSGGESTGKNADTGGGGCTNCPPPPSSAPPSPAKYACLIFTKDNLVLQIEAKAALGGFSQSSGKLYLNLGQTIVYRGQATRDDYEHTNKDYHGAWYMNWFDGLLSWTESKYIPGTTAQKAQLAWMTRYGGSEYHSNSSSRFSPITIKGEPCF